MFGGNRRYKYVVGALLVLFLFTILISNRTYPTNPTNDIERTLENVSCYYEDGGVLPVLGSEFSPKPESIYFHETSCRGGLNSRQACAVEAAARAHPDWQVHVLILSPVRNVTQPSFQALKMSPNVNLYRVHLMEYAQGTLLETTTHSGVLNTTQWKISHTSDFLRYLTLYKWGGIYLDLDTVVMKNLEVLGMNWAARESTVTVAAGALAFYRDSLGRMIADAAVRNLAENWRGDVWGHNGPGVITRVLKKVCGIEDVTRMSSDICGGFEVYGPEVFYPVDWTDNKDYFKPQHRNYSKAFVHHVWNKLTHTFNPPKDSLYSSLARQYCPNVFEAYSDDFGT